MSLSALITNSDNLEEELSAEEFIKTLKKVDSQDDGKKAERSSCSSSSGSTDKIQNAKCEGERKKSIEKKGSSSDLLLKMRSRFQHRATEPVFHTLATSAQEVRPASNNNRPASEAQTTP